VNDEADRELDRTYLTRLERLARAVVDEAFREGWLAYNKEDEIDPTRLQQAINALARNVRFYHSEGDGCVGHD
jgi:hypothetical protein